MGASFDDAPSTMGISHVLNRGVDKRNIFLDNRDYLRFILNLFEFNSIKSPNRHGKGEKGRHRMTPENKPEAGLVNIYAFCLMQNHYHLLLEEKIEKGIPLFMKKINMGYARYFNEKHRRSGALFEGRYKSVIVDTDRHFLYLPYYIHFNPLDLKMPEWREGKIRDYKKAMDFLNTYHWSSHSDYTGKDNFPLIIERNFLLEVFGGINQYVNDIEERLKEMESFDEREVILE